MQVSVTTFSDLLKILLIKLETSFFKLNVPKALSK